MIARRSVAVAVLAAALAVGAAPARAQWIVGGATTEVPLDGNGQSWLVRATLGGRVPGLFLLDTGASYCVINPALAARLGLPPSAARVSLQTANGVVQAPLVQIPTVEVGGNRARGVQAVVHQAVAAPLDGIIGLSFLNNFTYSVDPRRRVLRLH